VTTAEIERRLAQLKPVQRAVLSGRCRGLSVKEIAVELGYSEQRIYQHLAAVYEVFGMQDLNGYGRRGVLGEYICPVLRLGGGPAILPDEDRPVAQQGGGLKGIILAGGTGARACRR
jgi:DNA-binding CsgD family transcriptional regulator